MIQTPKFYERAREIANRVSAPHGRFAAKAAQKKGELYLYDDIGASWLSDGITAKDVAAKLDGMKGVSDLSIFINSPGGSVFEGVAILSLLERFDAKKTVYVDGIAASIASVIAMAGERVVMHRAATFMIHDPYTMEVGNSAKMRETADVLDKLADSIVAAYGKRTGKDAKDLREWMRAETWMTAEEAVARGFAHEIQSEEPANRAPVAAVAPKAQPDPRKQADYARAQAALLRDRYAGASPGVPGQPGTTKNAGNAGRTTK